MTDRLARLAVLVWLVWTAAAMACERLDLWFWRKTARTAAYVALRAGSRALDARRRVREMEAA